jgi:Na+/H+-dicarboxylate symporter
MLVGTVVGVLGGLYCGDVMLQIGFLGTLFLNALKMVVIPLVVASMIVGVTSLGDVRTLGRTGVKTLAYYLATTAASVMLGLVLVNILQPGVGVAIWQTELPEIVAKGQGKTVADIVMSLVPSNVVAAAAEGQILPLIVFSLLFGGVLSVVGEKGKPVIAVFEGINAAMMKIVHLIIWFAPIGVLALIGGIVARERGSLDQLMSGLGMYSLTVIIGLAVHGAVTLPLLLWLLGKKRPLAYFVGVGEALATAFTTSSSSATLPITIDNTTENNGIDSRAASFVLPLGATINMDGTALYEAVAAMFIAQISGIDLTLGQQAIVFLTATLVSIGAAGIPHAGTVMMVMVLSAVNLPIEGIGLIFAVDWFLDRCRTTVNVWGDTVGAAVIAQTKEFRR